MANRICFYFLFIWLVLAQPGCIVFPTIQSPPGQELLFAVPVRRIDGLFYQDGYFEVTRKHLFFKPIRSTTTFGEKEYTINLVDIDKIAKARKEVVFIWTKSGKRYKYLSNNRDKLYNTVDSLMTTP